MKLTSYTLLGMGLFFALVGLVQHNWLVFVGGVGFIAGWFLGATSHEQ